MSVLPPERGRELLLLILALIPGIGPARTNAIIGRYGADPAILDADPASFSEVPGIGPTLAGEIASLFGNPAWRRQAMESARQQLERADLLGALVLTILDPRYPELLRELYDPPPLIFVRGDHSYLSRPGVAVVGTRKASTYGHQVTELICRDLVIAGQTIISGLAYGIDKTAHRAALDSGGGTVAVLGCGIDTIYTDRGGKLWPKIVERGAIISEEWIGREPAPENFPKRNRLISGLSAGTLIVESDLKGGSMITASYALEQNREVFAVPGSIFSPNSRGTNRLIQQCHAKPVHSAADILAELAPVGAMPPAPAGQQLATLPSGGWGPEASRIVEALLEGPLHIDLIAERCSMSIDTLLVHLFDLELKRAVAQEPGQLFRLRRC
ncbi:MAG: DNA-protecting protein DprA [Chlorobiaceae bacterium]|nr:DNA-protecting protein DprA [Chlorobiaceae bacterium]